MDLLNPNRNRMRYVIGDITASSSGNDGQNASAGRNHNNTERDDNDHDDSNHHLQQRTTANKRQQRRPICLKKTATTYSHHMQVHTLAESNSTLTSPATTMNIPLRMFIGQKMKKFPLQPNATPLIPKRIVYEQFEVGNEFPDNCILVLDLRPWVRAKEIKYSVMFVRNITAVNTTPEDVDKLASLWNALSANETARGQRDNKGQQNTHDAVNHLAEQQQKDQGKEGNLEDTDDNTDTTNIMRNNPPKVVFHLSVSRFHVQESFDTYPVDSTSNHVFLVQRPRQACETILAHQIVAKMNPRPLLITKPFGFTSQTCAATPSSTTLINQQKWHVSPILHSLVSTETTENEAFTPSSSYTS